MIRNRKSRPTARAAAASAAGCAAAWLISPAASALDWREVTSLTVGAGHDSNVALTAVNPLAVGNASLRVASEVTARDEGMSFLFVPELRSWRYDDDSQLDRDDTFATLGLTLRPNDRQTWSFGGNYSNEGTRTSEFETTGFVQADVDRIGRSASVGWARQTGVRGSVQASASSSLVDYGQGFLSPLVDYRYSAFQTGYSRVASARSSWGINAASSIVEGDQNRTTTTSRSVSASWTHAFSAVVESQLGLGLTEATTQTPFAEGKNSGVSFNFSLQRHWARWEFTASGERDLRPDNSGQLVLAEVLAFGTERRLNTRMSVHAGWEGTHVRQNDLFLRVEDRNYRGGRVSFDWQPKEHWVVSAGVSTRSQEASPRRATGLIAGISATYRGK